MQTPSIDELKARYVELKATGQKEGDFDAKVASAPSNPKDIPADKILLHETVPGGWYWTHEIKRGQTLRIVNTWATPGVAAQIWNANDISERLNPADTIKVQWTARISKGRVLLSDMGRVLMSITEDTCGYNDCVTGHSSALTNQRKYGDAPATTQRNSRDNFLKAVAKNGMSKKDVHPSINFFSGVETIDREGGLKWIEGACKAGDYIDLRAEMDVLICLSNCPHPLERATTYNAKAIDLVIWDAGDIAADDLCRTATSEAVRGFENTDPLFA